MKYRPLPDYHNKEEIQKILDMGSFEGLMLLSLRKGQNHTDWKYAQDICLKLAEYPNEAIRANACLGLAYVARTKNRLEKHLVKPVLLRELRSNKEYKWRIEDAIWDINLYLSWHILDKPAR